MHKKILAKEKNTRKTRKKIQENTRTHTPLEPKHTDTRKGLGDGGGGGGERRRRRRGREDSVAAGEHSDGETTGQTKGPTNLGSWFRDGLSQGT
jgi:hypothetical protein